MFWFQGEFDSFNCLVNVDFLSEIKTIDKKFWASYLELSKKIILFCFIELIQKLKNMSLAMIRPWGDDILLFLKEIHRLLKWSIGELVLRIMKASVTLLTKQIEKMQLTCDDFFTIEFFFFRACFSGIDLSNIWWILN